MPLQSCADVHKTQQQSHADTVQQQGAGAARMQLPAHKACTGGSLLLAHTAAHVYAGEDAATLVQSLLVHTFSSRVMLVTLTVRPTASNPLFRASMYMIFSCMVLYESSISGKECLGTIEQ